MSRAEKVKQALTDSEVVITEEVDEGNIIEGEEIEIDRPHFRTYCLDLLEKCWQVVDKAIANAKEQKPNMKIDFFLTVGGSSCMPMIRTGLIDRYGAVYGKGKQETDWLRIHEPNIAIAKGAAKYAQMLANSDQNSNQAEMN